VRVLPLIDRLLESCTPEQNVESRFRDKELGQKVAVLYRAYRKLLISCNQMDFPSLLHCVVELLEAKPQISKHIRTVYKHICVDEFQDTNLAQYIVLQHIVGDTPQNLFVVADDDQIIYQWNGASPERLRQLESDYQMNVIQLPANYRCPPAVIGLANRLIKNNLDRSPAKQPLIAIKTEAAEDVIRLLNFDTFEEELDWIAGDIEARHATERGECVILARSRKLLEQAVETLMKRGIQASMALRKDEFTSAPIRWLHAILRLANARGDREQLRRLCKAFYELEGIHVDSRDIMANASVFGGDNLRSWFDMVLEREELEIYTRPFFETAQKVLADKLDFLRFIEAAFQWFEALNSRLADQAHEGFVDFDEEKVIWKDLQERIIKEYGKEELSLNILLQEVDLSPKMPPIPSGAVRCLTIHSAKGMEFQYVYLVGLAEEQLPSFQSIRKGDDSREMQEERRNCFVAITRAQNSLTLTYSQEYFGWRKKPSRFLREMELI
ncbi:MAG: ATP-dependent helicase, partial [Deltaproteobacteria bacterium]